MQAPGGTVYRFGLDFDVPSVLYPDKSFKINLPRHCREDPRFFNNRIVVVDAGKEGAKDPAVRPEYYKVPGRYFDDIVVKVPEGGPSNIYLLPVPTPPFDLEDVWPYTAGYSLVWNFRYSIEVVDDASVVPTSPIKLTGDDMLTQEMQTGHGFVHDCFGGADPKGDSPQFCQPSTGNCAAEEESTTSAPDTPVTLPPNPTTTKPSNSRKKLFMLAGQSNAEGNTRLDGLQGLANAWPAAGDTITDSVRTSLRSAIKDGQGNMCLGDGNPYKDEQADTLIGALQGLQTKWRDFATPGFEDSRVTIHAANFRHSKVTLADLSGKRVDNTQCNAKESETIKVGPPLQRYTSVGAQKLRVGFGTTITGYGPELAFGSRLADTVGDLDIVKVAMGGSSLGDSWRVNGTLYRQLVDDTRKTLAETGDDIGGLVWFQGYNDGCCKDVFCDEMKPRYGHNLVAFIRALRAELGQEFPVVVVKANHIVHSDIHTGQDNAVAALRLAKSTESKGMSNCFHYDSGSMIVIGEEAADAMAELLGDDGSGTTSPLPTTTQQPTTTTHAVYGLMNPSVRCGPSSDVPTKAIATGVECKQAASALGFGHGRFDVNSDDRPAGCWRDPNDSVYFNSNTSPSKPWSAPRSICEWDSPPTIPPTPPCDAKCKDQVQHRGTRPFYGPV